MDQLAPGIFHLCGGANMGLVVRDGQALLIDAGLDKDAARRALRAVDEAEAALVAVFITHGHADHFGGAHALLRRVDVPVYAPALEAGLMENPLFEPLFLFGGAAPIDELRHKFTLAKPCRVTHVVEPGALEIGPFVAEVVPLPGHAPNQMGLAVEGVLFCGDAVFPQETLDKHRVLFCAELDDMLATLERLPVMEYDLFAPGHGPAYRAGEEIETICEANAGRLREIRAQVHEALDVPREASDVLKRVADHFGLAMRSATSVYLTRATVLAALASLERAGAVAHDVENNRLLWRQA